jgi:hypothetical protein
MVNENESAKEPAWLDVTKIENLQAERTFILFFRFLDGMMPVPEGEASGDHEANQHADAEEEPIAGQSDEQDSNDRDGHDQGCGAAKSEAQAGAGRG